MVRPRWHDALIVAAIIALATAGAWALWWDDVRDAVFGKPTLTAPGQAPSAPTT
jgi:hypothetical protein